MTPKQREQFNRMRATLLNIARGYQTPDQLRRNSEKDFGCEFHECLEYAYENIQAEAKAAVKGVRELGR